MIEQLRQKADDFRKRALWCASFGAGAQAIFWRQQADAAERRADELECEQAARRFDALEASMDVE